MSQPKIHIIAISGTSCSGKGTIVNCCTSEFGFHHRSIRGMIVDAGSKLLGIPRNQITTRDHLRETARELRRKHGPACLVDFALETAPRDGKPIIIESIRASGEIDALKNHPDFQVTSIFLDAPHERRYEWSLKRNDASEQSSSGVVSYEQFLEREKMEWGGEDPSDLTKQNLSTLSKMCDHNIINDGTHTDLKDKVLKIIQKVLQTSA